MIKYFADTNTISIEIWFGHLTWKLRIFSFDLCVAQKRLLLITPPVLCVALLCFSFFVSAHGRFNRSRAIDSYTADEKTAEERNPIADSQAYTYPRARLSPSLKQAAPPSPLVCLSPSVSLSPSLCARWQRGGGGAGILRWGRRSKEERGGGGALGSRTMECVVQGIIETQVLYHNANPSRTLTFEG